MKREHFNELFIGLANVLELTDQNNGKASILSETTREVKDMLSQIECLKKENITLLSESQYVETEKKELEDENEVLQRQIHELQRALNKKMTKLNIPPSIPAEIECHEQVSQQATMAAPVYVIPVCSDLTSASLKPVSGVCKPHPRYPTPADSWPFKILQKDLVSSKESSQNGYHI
jgi:FtsZ-binding cell division protein ZapB